MTKLAQSDPGSVAVQPVLVLGLGNSLLADDGIGVHAARRLQQQSIPGVTVVEAGTAVLDIVHLLEQPDVVLALDAVQSGQAPGTVVEFRLNPDAPPPAMVSLHDVDLRQAMRLAGRSHPLPVIVLGVEPERLQYGLELSPTLQAVLPRFVDVIRRKATALVRQCAGAADTYNAGLSEQSCRMP